MRCNATNSIKWENRSSLHWAAYKGGNDGGRGGMRKRIHTK